MIRQDVDPPRRLGGARNRRGYRLAAVLAPTLVRLVSACGSQLFSPRKLRKPSTCAVTGAALPTGSVAWADVTSCAMNRADRIADAAIAAAAGS